MKALTTVTVFLLLLMLLTPVARAYEPCEAAFVIRDGKPFSFEVFSSPGFDPDTSPSIPWCDADGVPTPMLRDLIKKAKSSDRIADELAAEKLGRANDKQKFETDLFICEAASRECEETYVPPLKVDEPPSRLTWFSVGATVGIVVGVLLVFAGQAVF